jgi:FRG domain
MMETCEVRKLSDLVRLVEELRPVQGNVLFRGSRRDWDLLPGIARQLARGHVLDVEQRMLKKFQRHSLPFLEMRPETELDWLAVAQHHGLPTRLLDWSVNALASLWFAISEPPLKDDRGMPEPGVLWVFEPGLGHYITKRKTTDPFKIKRTRVLVPKYISKRIVAQGGYFTVHFSSEEEPHFQPMQAESRFENSLKKVIIPPSCFTTFRSDLNRLGVNNLTVYPDLSGLCSHLKWDYFYMADESPEVTRHPGRTPL